MNLRAFKVEMSALFDSCSICETAVPVVISRLVCCGRTCCLTCARDMFHLSGPSALSFAGPRTCTLCQADNPGARRDAHLFYRVQADLFGAVDEACGEFGCPRGCNFSGKSADIWAHLRRDCKFATTKCHTCRVTITRTDLEAHRASTCRWLRGCFCAHKILSTLPEYKAHVIRHSQHSRYAEMCALSAEPGSGYMILCSSAHFSVDDFVSVSIGCGCGGLFTLSAFVEHVASL